MQIHKLNDKAFTLIEIIVSLVLIGFMTAIVGMGLAQIVQGYVFSRQNEETVLKAHVAMARMVKELSAITVVSATTGTSITYKRILNPTDPAETEDPSSHTIALSGSQIQLDGVTLTDNVTAFSLAYYDASDPPIATTTAADIRRIDVNMSLQGAANAVSSFSDRVKILESYW